MKHLTPCLLLLAMLFGAPSVFATPFTYECTDCPLRVPPAGSLGHTTSTINVTDAGSITDLNVFVNISHSFVGDLHITLEHAGTSVVLFDQHGGSNDWLRQVTLDDEASTSIDAASAPYDYGTYQPSGDLLSSFDGLELTGDWTLTVSDLLVYDNGRLRNWKIFGDATTQVNETAPIALLCIGLLGLGVTRVRRNKTSDA